MGLVSQNPGRSNEEAFRPMQSEEAPLRQSKLELRAAKKALEEMRAAKDLEEFAVAWRSFLDQLEKVWVKVERECQPFRNRCQPWQGVAPSLRRKDELLRYLHQARNADHHSIQPTTQEIIAELQLTIPPLGAVQIHFDKEKLTLTINGECHSLVTRGPRYLLLPVTNQGMTFAPPTEHLGQKLPLNDAVLVAAMGLAFYEDYVAQVEAEFFPPSPANASAAD
jgi:hypothetical protein